MRAGILRWVPKKQKATAPAYVGHSGIVCVDVSGYSGCVFLKRLIQQISHIIGGCMSCDDVNPVSCLNDVLANVNTHRASKLDELLAHRWGRSPSHIRLIELPITRFMGATSGAAASSTRVAGRP